MLDFHMIVIISDQVRVHVAAAIFSNGEGGRVIFGKNSERERAQITCR